MAIFALFMIRPLFSYVLISLILTAQVGLPMHYHYCKGSLESVSILFRNACEEEVAASEAKSCCKKPGKPHCTKENNGCCKDQVKVISQDITSVAPTLIQLEDIALDLIATDPYVLPNAEDAVFLKAFDLRSPRAKPPFHILYRSFLC